MSESETVIRVRRPADALRVARRARRASTSTSDRGEVVLPPRSERRRQDHHDRDPRRIPAAVGRRRARARRRPGPRRRGLAGAHRRGAAVVAGPRRAGRRDGCSPTSGGYYAPYSDARAAASVRRGASCSTMVGLTEHADQKIATLSGGQRRRLDVAIGIVGRPELLFLDEPTAGFDPHARRDFHDLVLRLCRPRGHHDPAHDARPRRGGEARRPHPDPRRRPDRRRRQRRAARPGGGHRGTGAVEPQR